VCADGSLARSRATDTPLGRGLLEQRWRFTLTAPLSEEALVSGDYCLALSSESGKHFGQWFNLLTGQPIGDPLKAELPLAPCLAGNRAVLRLGQDRLVGIEIGPTGRRETCAWSLPSAGEPLFDGERVYVPDARGLVQLAWGQPQPVARLDLELIGRLAWLPDSLSILARSHKGGNFHWVQVPFDLSAPEYGQAALPLDAVDRGNRPARLFPGQLKSYCESEDIHWNGSAFAWLTAGPEYGLINGQLQLDSFSSCLLTSPAQSLQGTLGWLRHRSWERDYLMLTSETDQYVIYGPTLELEQRGPRCLTIAKDGVWIDRRAIALDGQSMVQLLPGRDPRWVIPTNHGPLVCREDRSFELWGPVRRAASPQRPPLADWPAELSTPAVLEDPKAIVLGDPAGPVFTGPFQLSEGRLSPREPEPAQSKGRKKLLPGLQPAELRLWMAGDGQTLHVADWPAFERGLIARLRITAVQALADGSLPAQQSSDPAVIARALALAREFGLEPETEKLAAAAERVERQGRKPRTDRAQVASAALDGFDVERQALVERAFTGLIGTQPDELGWEALRKALDDPKTREFARQRVDQSLPPGLDGSLGSPEMRLELARLHARRGLAVVGREGGVQAEANSVLAEELIRGRVPPGFVSLLSPDLLVFGAPEQFDDMVMAILRGQLLADQLTGFIGAPLKPIDTALFSKAPTEKPRRPLAVWVLGAEGDAQRFEARRRLQAPEFFGSKRAFYDDGNGLTLLLWPPGSAKFSSHEADLVYGLTTHWLDLRCPLYPDTRQARGGPGYWARVGLPLMAAELRFDVQAGLAVPNLRYSGTAMFLAALDQELWIPWPELLAKTATAIEVASQQPLAEIELPWWFNRFVYATTRDAHRTQSAQLCTALLFGAEQAHRAEFARVLGAYHRGDAAESSLLTEGGLDAAELERLMQTHLKDLESASGRSDD
jgi:hypothetical protein